MVSEEDDDMREWTGEDDGAHEGFINSMYEEERKEKKPVETQNFGNTGDAAGNEELERFHPIDKENTYKEWSKNFTDVKPGEVHSISIGFGQNLRRMTREGWEALRPYPRQPLGNSVSKIRFTHTGTEICNTTEECMKSVQDLQKYYMDLGFPDIPYNFLIGGDGVLYHARGWARVADRPQKYFNLKKTAIDVAYIGNFEHEKVPFNMISTGIDFIKYGLKIGKLTPFYQAYTFPGEKHV